MFKPRLQVPGGIFSSSTLWSVCCLRGVHTIGSFPLNECDWHETPRTELRRGLRTTGGGERSAGPSGRLEAAHLPRGARLWHSRPPACPRSQGLVPGLGLSLPRPQHQAAVLTLDGPQEQPGPVRPAAAPRAARQRPHPAPSRCLPVSLRVSAHLSPCPSAVPLSPPASPPPSFLGRSQYCPCPVRVRVSNTVRVRVPGTVRVRVPSSVQRTRAALRVYLFPQGEVPVVGDTVCSFCVLVTGVTGLALRPGRRAGPRTPSAPS